MYDLKLKVYNRFYQTICLGFKKTTFNPAKKFILVPRCDS